MLGKTKTSVWLLSPSLHSASLSLPPPGQGISKRRPNQLSLQAIA
jgi:hypothetical protein